MRSLIEKYSAYLPITDRTPRITLGEGSTPLIRSTRIGPSLGLDELYFKYEGLNPTGSFKDRGMVVATAKAMEAGAKVLLCASTGNTSASAAAYAAHCGLRAVVVVPAGGVAAGKLVQAMAYGARIMLIRGSFDRALELVRELAGEPGITVVNSINPDRIEGQKTAAFEILEDLGHAPAELYIPVGNAGNITAYWRGFCEKHAQTSSGLPMLRGAQAEGAAPIVRGKAVARPRTVASAIRIGNPASWKAALQARDASEGSIEAVTDQEILAAHRRLSAEEGLLVEPASAASVALLIKRAQHHEAPREPVVCVLTGHGLKDPKAITRGVKLPQPIEPSSQSLRRALSS